MRRFLLLFFSIIVWLPVFSQSREISGQLSDRDTKESMAQTTVQLLRARDSSFVSGTLSDNEGKFKLSAPADGRYLVRITSVGYKAVIKHANVENGKDVILGSIVMGADAVMLKGTTITGQATKVSLKEDTFVYNASAFRTPEGSTIEELVKRLPGAQVSSDGKITVNGKEVKKILVDGKEFMTGDTKTALKNIPSSVINKIKAYDQKSDMAKVTGIDDGEEQTVLDFGMKDGMNKGSFGNIDLAIGSQRRYAEKAMGGWFNGNHRLMMFANANNVNDMGFPGGGFRGFGAGPQGLNASKMLGLNYNYELKDRLQMDASVRWNHSDGDVNALGSMENFVSRIGAFSNNNSSTLSRSNSWDGQLRLEWTPDTMTNILFRPQFTYNRGDNLAHSLSATFSKDPYLYVANPLLADAITRLDAENLVVNTQENSGISDNSNKSLSGTLQYNRKFGTKGCNVTLRVGGNYGSSDGHELTLNNIHLYQVQNVLGQDSTYQTNRWKLVPTTNYGYKLKFAYSEPIAHATFLQFSYEFQYKYSKSNRKTYDFSNLGETFFSGLPFDYGNWNSYLGRLANPLDDYYDQRLSRYSTYRNYIHEFQLMLRLIRKKYNLNVGVMLQPQKSKYLQNYQGIHVDTMRTVTNFSPTLDFRYRFNKVSNLRINYRGTTSQPSMSQLLSITDDSDPLNISKGNAGLKPSFTNNFRLFYNNYVEKRQRAIMTFVNYSNTHNSISNKVTYDERTGGRTIQPENINGNWNAMGAFMFNTAIDSAGFFNVNTFTNVNYNHYVAYLALNSTSSSVKNITRSTSLGERLETSYRNSWLELAVDGSVNYMHSRNQLQRQSNLDTWQFSYGGSVNISLPWGTTLATDLHNNSRRGFNDASMNTNELIWNAQISQSMLKGRPLSISLQFYDILHKQSNFSRSVNALMRSDTEYNSIYSYAMLHVIYRFNLFGGKEARKDMPGPPMGGRERRGTPPPPPGGRGGFGGPPRF